MSNNQEKTPFEEKLKLILKNSVPVLICLAVLLVINMIVFQPQFEGKKLPQGDIINSVAKTHHIREYAQEKKDAVLWNPSMFSGLPTGFLTYSRHTNSWAKTMKKTLTLSIKRPIGLFFLGGVIAFITLLCFGLKPIYALCGAISFGLNTNHFVLYEAGHIHKIDVLVVLPLLTASILLAWQKKYFLGSLLMMAGASLAIYSNHIQMVYYLTLALVVFGACFLITSLVTKKDLKPIFVGTGAVLLAGLLGILSNYSQLVSAKNFSDDTMRGKAILAPQGAVQNSNSSSTKDGLNWEYSMNWSNEAKDLWVLLVPNAVGGSSSLRVKPDNEMASLFTQNNPNAVRNGFVNIPAYWGGLPFTAGSCYVGASIFFLFILALLSLPRPFAVAFAGAVITILILSLGINASWINRPLFDHLPLFAKFRAPNSAMTVLPSIITIGAFFGLYHFFRIQDVKEMKRIFLRALATSLGFCLLLLILGNTFFDFLKPSEVQQYEAGIQGIFKSARKSLLNADAFRSILFILATAGTLSLLVFQRLKSHLIVGGLLSLLVMADLIPVGRRNIKNTDFISVQNYDDQFAPNQNDQFIFSQEPKGRGYYRVLDLSTNTFNDAKPSYHHNQIGGYDPAKLQRYQDMIDYYISRGNMDVLSMLNTKYIVNRDGRVQQNPQAFGNAWFVKGLIKANSPNEEIESIGQISNLRDTAVVLTSEFSAISDLFASGNGSGTIQLSGYKPDKLTYSSQSESDQVAVFSESWYGPNKGWEVTIDGDPTEHFRANYMLRAMKVPAGDHEIIFEFKPQPKGSWVSRIASFAIFGFLALGLFMGIRDYVPPTPEKQTAPSRKKSKVSGKRSTKRKRK